MSVTVMRHGAEGVGKAQKKDKCRQTVWSTGKIKLLGTKELSRNANRDFTEGRVHWLTSYYTCLALRYLQCWRESYASLATLKEDSANLCWRSSP
jgi:hypothetical protein